MAEEKRETFWNFKAAQMLGILLLAMLGISWLKLGTGFEFLLVDFAAGAGFLGGLHILGRVCGDRGRHGELIPEAELFPFQNFASIRAVHESVPSFHKMPYPREMGLMPSPRSRLWRGVANGVMLLPWLIYWPLLALIGLAACCRGSRYTVMLAVDSRR